jgi:PAS domain S-box-containing protein
MVLEAICRIGGIDSGGVCRVDPHSGEVVLVAHTGISQEMATELARHDPDMPQAKVNRARQPVYLDAIHDIPGLAPVYQRESLRALAIIPISCAGEVVAQLNCSSHTLDRIPGAARPTLEAIAAQVGGAIAHISAQTELVNSQRNLQNLFETLDDFLFILGADGRILYTNPVVPHRLGYTPGELARMNVLEVHPPGRRQEAAATVADMLAGRSSFCPIPLCAKGGALIPVETRVTPGQWSGQPVLFGISRDVSERIQTMNALRESREQLQRVLDGSNDGFWDWNVATGAVSFSPRWAEMLGYRLDEIEPRVTAWEALLHPDDRPSVERALADHLEGRTPQYVSEQRLRTRGGGWKWILDRGRVVERDAEGRATRMAGTHTDIAERKRAEEDVRRRSEFERLLAAISASFINLPVDAIDAEIQRAMGQIGAFAAVDRSYVFLFDAALESMSNTHEWCAAGIEPQIDNLQAIPTSVFPWWVARLKANEPINVERLADLPPEAGAEREILEAQDIQSILVVPIRAQDRLIGHLGFDAVRSARAWPADAVAMIRFVADIVANALERKTADQRVRQALAKEKELSELRSTFVSSVSHEFRTPLTTILSSAEMLQHYAERLAPDRKLRYLEQIQASARYMTSLMDDVLTISRADSGLQCHPQPMDLPQFCRELIEEVRLTSRVQHDIAFACAGECSAARLDEKLLRSILVNLLSNALKYSPDGAPVALDLDCRDGRAAFAVRDRGIGIPPESHPFLFVPFHRASNVGSVSGTGLGLPIVKRSVDAHGGTIAFDSQVGAGTTFVVTLPLNPADGRPRIPAQ